MALAARVRVSAHRLLERLGDPLTHWSPIDRALVLNAVQVLFVAGMALSGWRLLHNPTLEPYYNRSLLRYAEFMLICDVIGTPVAMAIGWGLARRGHTSRVYLHLNMQWLWLLTAASMYLFGPVTTPLWLIFALLGFYSLLCLDAAIVAPAVVTSGIVVFGTAIAERVGVLPYAPLLTGFPVNPDGRIANPWFWSNMLWPATALVVSFGVFDFIIRRSRRYAAEAAFLTARLQQDLDKAAKYARSLLPEPLDGTGGVQAEWSYVPSTELAGDAFTYLWLDDDHFAVALLDVCGHGVSSALHGVAAIEAIRTQSLASARFTDPASVLRGMNGAFQMDTHGDLYLTLWYGVYHRPSRTLRFASAGHPPAILRDGTTLRELRTSGPPIGTVPDARYSSAEVALAPGAELWVLSDGVFELDGPDGAMEWSQLLEVVRTPTPAGASRVSVLRAFAERFTGRQVFDDDFSVVRLEFR